MKTQPRETQRRSELLRRRGSDFLKLTPEKVHQDTLFSSAHSTRFPDQSQELYLGRSNLPSPGACPLNRQHSGTRTDHESLLVLLWLPGFPAFPGMHPAAPKKPLEKGIWSLQVSGQLQDAARWQPCLCRSCPPLAWDGASSTGAHPAASEGPQEFPPQCPSLPEGMVGRNRGLAVWHEVGC